MIEIFSANAGNSMVLNARKGTSPTDEISASFSPALIDRTVRYPQEPARPLFSGSFAKELFGMAFLNDLDNHFPSTFRMMKELQASRNLSCHLYA